MHQLSPGQVASLRAVLALCETAASDLAESLETGLMSDSKSSVHDVLTTVEHLSLPIELSKHLQETAKNAWHLTVAGGDDVFSRAGAGLGAIGKLEELVKGLLGVEH